jgi:fucose permease
MPTFAIRALGFSQLQMGWILSLVFAGQAILMLGGSAVSQFLLGRGFSSRVSRAGLNSIALMIGGCALFAATFVSDPVVAIILVGIGTGLPIITFTINPALISEILPSRHRNRMLQIIMSLGTTGAMVAPWLIGRLVGDLEGNGWNLVLTINAIVLIVGGLLALWLINPERSRERLAARDDLAA